MKSEISDEITVIKDTSALLTFKDKDPNSNFFYTIKDVKLAQGKFHYTVNRAPHDTSIIENRSYSFTVKELLSDFENWKKLLKTYNETPFFAENEILNKYASEFYEMYKIDEDDADTSPFDIKRQLLLDKYLEKSIEIIDHQQKANKDVDLSDLRVIANEIRNEQTKYTKNETIKQLSKFWAIAREKGLPYLMKFFSDFAQKILIEIVVKPLLGT